MSEQQCPICGGSGWRIVERAGLSGAARCSCVAVARAQTAREKSGIPPAYSHATLENFEIPKNNPVARQGLGTVLMQVRSFVREYPAGERPGLILTGGTGTGKTFLAVAALRALIDRGHEGVFFDYQNLLERIRSSYNSASGSSDREAYQSALDSEVLLLDDLGSHRVTEWVEDTVTSIITHRCNHRKTLIATTNLELGEGEVGYVSAGGTAVHKKQIGEVIGARARSRLFEMCRVIKMPAVEDFRIARGRN